MTIADHDFAMISRSPFRSGTPGICECCGILRDNRERRIFATESGSDTRHRVCHCGKNVLIRTNGYGEKNERSRFSRNPSRIGSIHGIAASRRDGNPDRHGTRYGHRHSTSGFFRYLRFWRNYRWIKSVSRQKFRLCDRFDLKALYRTRIGKKSTGMRNRSLGVRQPIDGTTPAIDTSRIADVPPLSHAYVRTQKHARKYPSTPRIMSTRIRSLVTGSKLRTARPGKLHTEWRMQRTKRGGILLFQSRDRNTRHGTGRPVLICIIRRDARCGTLAIDRNEGYGYERAIEYRWLRRSCRYRICLRK